MYKKPALTMIAVAVVVAVAFVYFTTNSSDDPIEDFYFESSVSETENLQAQENPLSSDSSYALTADQEPSDLHGIIESLFHPLFHQPLSWDDYVYMLERGTPVNQTLTYGSFELEVLGAIAVAEPAIDWEKVFDIYEETGEWLHYHDYVEISLYGVRMFYFVSLHDTSGETDLSDVRLGDVEIDFVTTHFNLTFIIFVHYDARTSKAYLVVGDRIYMPPCTTVLSSSFTIGQVNIGQTFFTKDLGIPIAGLLNNHEASFDEFGIMYFNELNIYVYGGRYITNIALRDNLLRVQTIEPFERVSERTHYDWLSLTVVDTRVEPISNLTFFQNVDLRAVRLIQTAFLTRFFGKDVLELNILEYEFYIPDLNVLPYLDFSVFGAYFEKRIPVHFDFPGVEVPIHEMPCCY